MTGEGSLKTTYRLFAESVTRRNVWFFKKPIYTNNHLYPSPVKKVEQHLSTDDSEE